MEINENANINTIDRYSDENSIIDNEVIVDSVISSDGLKQNRSRSMDWFLYDNGLRHERVNPRG